MSRSDTYRRSVRGAAMLEISTALFVAATGMFGVLTMFQHGARSIHASQDENIATRAVQNELETLRGLPFEALEIAEERDFVSDTPEVSRLVRPKASVTIKERTSGEGDLREVTITLRWTGEGGRKSRRSVTTLIARKGRT